MTPARLLTLVLLFVLAHAALAAGEVRLEIAPSPVVMNESCRITFQVTGAADADPDFAPLEAHFDILGRNRQTSIKWVNGAREQTTTWVLSAMAKRPGTVEIPPIAFGTARSPARTVSIVHGAAPAADAGAEILLEVEATPDAPYVQQQVIYTVRLLHHIELSSPRFSSLTTSADAIIKPLGKGRQFVEKRGGRTYEAFEQRYAIFPQQSGELVVNPLVLTTQVVTGKRSFFDPFSRTVTTRRVESDAVRVEVRPIPDAFPPGATWLPAARLRLYEEWEPDVTQTEAGTPLSRTLFLWADGLTGGQLPEIAFDPPAGVKVYPDQPQTNEQDTATGFTAVMQEKFALIPSSDGVSTFPAIEVPWWNTERDTLEIARLPERRLAIAAPAGAATSPPDGAVSREPAAPSATPAARAPGGPWFALTLVFAAAWALTLLAWWRHARRRPATPVESAPAARPSAGTAGATRDLKSACAAHAPRAARDALLAWARSGPFAPAPLTLRALAEATGGDLGAEVRALEQALYGGDAGPWHGEALWDAFRRWRPAGTPRAAANDEALPRLFRLAGK